MLNVPNEIGILQQNECSDLSIVLLICERKVSKMFFACENPLFVTKNSLDRIGKWV